MFFISTQNHCTNTKKRYKIVPLYAIILWPFAGFQKPDTHGTGRAVAPKIIRQCAQRAGLGLRRCKRIERFTARNAKAGQIQLYVTAKHRVVFRAFRNGGTARQAQAVQFLAVVARFKAVDKRAARQADAAGVRTHMRIGINTPWLYLQMQIHAVAAPPGARYIAITIPDRKGRLFTVDTK